MLKIAILAVLYELSIVALVQERVVKVTVALARAMMIISVSPFPPLRTLPALARLPASSRLSHVVSQQELLLFTRIPLHSRLRNFGNVCPQRLWTEVPIPLQHSRVHLAISLKKVPDMPPTGQSGVNNNSLLDWSKQNFRLWFCFKCGSKVYPVYYVCVFAAVNR